MKKLIGQYAGFTDGGSPTGLDKPNPEKYHTLLGLPEWAGYTFGSIFIVLGILIILLYKKSKEKANLYRKRQMEEYKKLHPKSKATYSQTGMFLPAWEKAKLFAPILFGSVFIIIGIAWMVGKTLFSV